MANERLQGAQEAVAHEVAAAEPEMPPLLAEPSLEAGRVMVIQFDKHAGSGLPTMPALPALSNKETSAAVAKRLQALSYPPVFGGAARLFASMASASEEAEVHSPINPFHMPEDENPESELLEGLGETTPSLGAVSAEYLEGAGVQAETPTQPWLPALQEPSTPTPSTQVPSNPLNSKQASSKQASSTRARPPAKLSEASGTRQVSKGLLWGVAVVLSLVAVPLVLLLRKEPRKATEEPTPLVVALLEEPTPPVPQPRPLKRVAPKPNPKPQPKGTPLAAQQKKKVPPNPEKTELLAKVEDKALSGTALNGTALSGTLNLEAEAKAQTVSSVGMVGKPKTELGDERLVAALEVARKHVQRDRYELALPELVKIQPLLKKYPTHALEFEFLYGVSLAFEAKNARQTTRALRVLGPLRSSHRTSPEYWYATGFANQVLGMDESKTLPERRKFLLQAKSDYAESLRLGRNNAKYKEVPSYIEHIERELQGFVDANAGD
ncbi:MAG: hypothetical protein FWG75_10295 [Cystobacterineae bacterium]|nr:hypothetical protein [Cystobacterineae bacterium]